MIVADNLDTVDPRGRFDVLLYKGAQYVTEQVEQTNSVNGIWDAIKPHVGTVIVESLTGVEIPGEAIALLKILQANIAPKIGG